MKHKKQHRHQGRYRSRTPRGGTVLKRRPIHSQMAKYKDLSYKQLKKKFDIPAYADDDKDGVLNKKDCRPWDKKRHFIQSLFHAGNEPPSKVLEEGKPLYGFSSKDFAEGWKDKMGYENVYQFATSDYDIDPRQYSRDTPDGPTLSDNEFVAKDVIVEKELHEE